MPKISIIVPMYNVARYVRAALTSVQKQTFSDWECICVDDGSPDNCADIVAEFAAADPRFILVRQSNGGVSSARNHGLELARGEYFAFLDPDDVYVPTFLEMTYAAAKYYNVDLVQTDVGTVPENFELAYSGRPYETINLDFIPTILRGGPDPIFDNWHPDFMTGGIWCFVWRNIYKRSVFGDVRFPLGIHPGEDDLYMIAIVTHLNSYAKLHEIGVYYRQSRTSVVRYLERMENIEKKIANLIQLVQIGYQYADGLPNNSRYKVRYYKMMMETVYRAMFIALSTDRDAVCDFLCDNLDPKTLRELLKYCLPRPKRAVRLFFRRRYEGTRKVLKMKTASK